MLRSLSAMFGLSGVGKTYMANEACRRFPSLLHAEAGTLLSVELSKSKELLRTSSKASIERNQRLLISATRKLHLQFPARPILFDGHIFIDNNRELVPVPLEVIRELCPTILIWVYDDPKNILKRRCEDERPRPPLPVSIIERQQRFGRDLCRSYASRMQVSFAEVKSGNLKALFHALSED
jgi:adenylate kinase